MISGAWEGRCVGDLRKSEKGKAHRVFKGSKKVIFQMVFKIFTRVCVKLLEGV